MICITKKRENYWLCFFCLCPAPSIYLCLPHCSTYLLSYHWWLVLSWDWPLLIFRSFSCLTKLRTWDSSTTAPVTKPNIDTASETLSLRSHSARRPPPRSLGWLRGSATAAPRTMPDDLIVWTTATLVRTVGWWLYSWPRWVSQPALHAVGHPRQGYHLHPANYSPIVMLPVFSNLKKTYGFRKINIRVHPHRSRNFRRGSSFYFN